MNTATKQREQVAQEATSQGDLAPKRDLTPAEHLREQMERQKPEFDLVLPPGVTVDRFVRTIMTAVQADPDLMEANRKSLLQSAMQAAQDGLLPDKREGAFVIYNTKEKIDGGEQWIKKVQWMPMIRGIIKKAREGGEIGTLSARVVYENDVFEYVLGDEERIRHEPTLNERGKLIACYAIAKLKDGEIEREVMSAEDVAAVRSASKSRNGPWTGPFEPEMWRKTVTRRLLKRLPLSPILEQVINRDEGHYEFRDVSGNRVQRQTINAPAAPRREDFIEQEVIEATANEATPLMIADQIEAAIKAAPDVVELSGIWATAMRDGDLNAIKHADHGRHARLCEIYNATHQAFDEALAKEVKANTASGTGEPGPDDEDEAERQQDDDHGQTNDSAGTDELTDAEMEAATAFVGKSVAEIQGFKNAKALINWFNTTFKTEAVKRRLSQGQIENVARVRDEKIKTFR